MKTGTALLIMLGMALLLAGMLVSEPLSAQTRPVQVSQEEIVHSPRLRDRQKELDAREERLARREKQLAELERELERELETLLELQREVKAALESLANR